MLAHCWGKILWALCLMPYELWSFPVWLVATGNIFSFVWALYTILFDSFLWFFPWSWVVSSYMCWSILCSILDGTFCRSTEFSLYDAIFFLGTLFCHSSRLGFLGLSTPSPQLWNFSGLCLGFLSLHCGNSLKQYVEAIIGLTLFVSHFSRVTLLCCLMFSILNNIVLHFFVFLFEFFR